MFIAGFMLVMGIAAAIFVIWMAGLLIVNLIESEKVRHTAGRIATFIGALAIFGLLLLPQLLLRLH